MYEKTPLEFKGKTFYHSNSCQWSGKKRTRYTQTKGLCEACDIIRGQILKVEEELFGMPLNTFGLAKEDRDRIYCLNATVPYAKCTAKTNPSCACGKLIYHRSEGV